MTRLFCRLVLLFLPQSQAPNLLLRSYLNHLRRQMHSNVPFLTPEPTRSCGRQEDKHFRADNQL